MRQLPPLHVLQLHVDLVSGFDIVRDETLTGSVRKDTLDLSFGEPAY